MTFRTSIISILFLSAVYLGCDSVDSSAPDMLSPEIRVVLVDDNAAVSKSAVLVDVQLQVRSLGGTDYSPPSVTVDNASTRSVDFDVSVPADSLFTFLVRVTRSGSLVAEGATLQKVTLATTDVEIKVLQTTGATPSLAILPSQIITSTGPGDLTLQVRYYGASPAAGIAALFDVTGSTPRPFTLEGAEVNFLDGQQLNAAWRFADDIQGAENIGTITFSRSAVANFCLEADANNIRVVNRAGEITASNFLGTCISITQ